MLRRKGGARSGIALRNGDTPESLIAEPLRKSSDQGRDEVTSRAIVLEEEKERRRAGRGAAHPGLIAVEGTQPKGRRRSPGRKCCAHRVPPAIPPHFRAEAPVDRRR